MNCQTICQGKEKHFLVINATQSDSVYIIIFSQDTSDY